jgi:hypothetical protein
MPTRMGAQQEIGRLLDGLSAAPMMVRYLLKNGAPDRPLGWCQHCAEALESCCPSSVNQLAQGAPPGCEGRCQHKVSRDSRQYRQAAQKPKLALVSASAPNSKDTCVLRDRSRGCQQASTRCCCLAVGNCNPPAPSVTKHSSVTHQHSYSRKQRCVDSTPWRVCMNVAGCRHSAGTTSAA